MKIIKPSPILNSTDTWQQTCSYCEAVLEYDVQDISDLHYYSDQREGDYYSAKIRCPSCRKLLEAAVPKKVLKLLYNQCK